MFKSSPPCTHSFPSAKPPFWRNSWLTHFYLFFGHGFVWVWWFDKFADGEILDNRLACFVSPFNVFFYKIARNYGFEFNFGVTDTCSMKFHSFYILSFIFFTIALLICVTILHSCVGGTCFRRLQLFNFAIVLTLFLTLVLLLLLLLPLLLLLSWHYLSLSLRRTSDD